MTTGWVIRAAHSIRARSSREKLTCTDATIRKGMGPLTSQNGHGGRVVTLLPPTSEAGVRFPTQPQVGKLVVACRWSAVYSTEP